MLHLQTYGNHFAFCGHVSWPVWKSQFGLQGVEICFQFCLLFDAGWLVDSPVSTVFFELLLHIRQRIVSMTIGQPWHGAPDPLQQLWLLIENIFLQEILHFKNGQIYCFFFISYITSKALILLHEALIFLVHLQDLTDAVGSCLGLRN